jgi:20S proteasome alpha/beta subunit
MLSRCLVLALLRLCSASDRGQGRYSYSLTTFDPSGKLGQVHRAMQAAEQGTPIVAMVHAAGVIVASPQVLPLFAIDDGTARFSLVSPEILIAHSGLAADGRILVAAAQRMAVEHEYTFDENIDIDIFLEEISLLFQEYTIQVATRPFGASLLIAHVPRFDRSRKPTPTLYKIDPSGNVAVLGDCAVVHGNLESTDIVQNLQSVRERGEALPMDEVRDEVVKVLREALQQQASMKHGEKLDELTVLTATLHRDVAHRHSFQKQRFNLEAVRS